MRLGWLALGITLTVAAGCTVSMDATDEVGDGYTGPGDTSGTGGAGGASTSTGTGTTSGSGGDTGVQPGTLTAGAWDDNRNYDFFVEYLSAHAQLAGAPPLAMDERDAANARALQPALARERLDVALVIDTTGSMTDELSYLQVEFDAPSSQIETLYPNADQHWSLVLHRDEGDAYVVRSFDFTDDLAASRSDLQAQSADGGGDTPEAPDAALDEALALEWRTGSVARLVFWLADAPHHTGAAAAMAEAGREAAARDIHIYLISASGIDELGELTMRSLAQLSLGRYLFLTDDSGVGGTHKEPTIPATSSPGWTTPFSAWWTSR